jgi:hypothetical protein
MYLVRVLRSTGKLTPSGMRLAKLCARSGVIPRTTAHASPSLPLLRSGTRQAACSHHRPLQRPPDRGSAGSNKLFRKARLFREARCNVLARPFGGSDYDHRRSLQWQGPSRRGRFGKVPANPAAKRRIRAVHQHRLCGVRSGYSKLPRRQIGHAYSKGFFFFFFASVLPTLRNYHLF